MADIVDWNDKRNFLRRYSHEQITRMGRVVRLGTVPQTGWPTLLRMHGPLEPWIDNTWRPGEFELV